MTLIVRRLLVLVAVPVMERFIMKAWRARKARKAASKNDKHDRDGATDPGVLEA